MNSIVKNNASFCLKAGVLIATLTSCGVFKGVIGDHSKDSGGGGAAAENKPADKNSGNVELNIDGFVVLSGDELDKKIYDSVGPRLTYITLNGEEVRYVDAYAGSFGVVSADPTGLAAAGLTVPYMLAVAGLSNTAATAYSMKYATKDPTVKLCNNAQQMDQILAVAIPTLRVDEMAEIRDLATKSCLENPKAFLQALVLSYSFILKAKG